MKLYLAGPMTGHPQFNYPAFEEAAGVLRRMGLDIVSPAEMDDPADQAAALASPNGLMSEFHSTSSQTWGDFLARDVKLLVDDGIEGVVVLPGWHKSRGSRLETFVAKQMAGLPIYLYKPEWLPHMDQVSDLALVDAWAGELDVLLGGA